MYSIVRTFVTPQFSDGKQWKTPDPLENSDFELNSPEKKENYGVS